MSRLYTRAPTTVEIDGAEYPINVDFRACLLTIACLQDDDLMDSEKAEILLENMYFEPYPVNIQEAVAKAVDYLMQGREIDEDEHKKPVLLDFEQDGQFLYDAFLKKGINLDNSDMSYWEFSAHLRELPEHCAINRIVYLRQQQKRNKLTKEEKTECQRIGWGVINIKDKNAESFLDELGFFN